MLKTNKKKSPLVGTNVQQDVDIYLRLYSLAYNVSKAQSIREAIDWWMRQKPNEEQVIIDLRKRILNLHSIEKSLNGYTPKEFVDKLKNVLKSELPPEYVYKILNNLIN